MEHTWKWNINKNTKFKFWSDILKTFKLYNSKNIKSIHPLSLRCCCSIWPLCRSCKEIFPVFWSVLIYFILHVPPGHFWQIFFLHEFLMPTIVHWWVLSIWNKSFDRRRSKTKTGNNWIKSSQKKRERDSTTRTTTSTFAKPTTVTLWLTLAITL